MNSITKWKQFFRFLGWPMDAAISEDEIRLTVADSYSVRAIFRSELVDEFMFNLEDRYRKSGGDVLILRDEPQWCRKAQAVEVGCMRTWTPPGFLPHWRPCHLSAIDFGGGECFLGLDQGGEEFTGPMLLSETFRVAFPHFS